MIRQKVAIFDKCKTIIFVENAFYEKIILRIFIIYCFLETSTQSNFSAAGCKIMQHYVTNSHTIVQHYVIRGDISPHFRRLIAVNDRFCGDNLIGI